MLGKGISNQREAIARQAVGDYEDSMMRALVAEKLNRETDKIVPVPGHKATPLLGGPVELVPVREPFSPDLVGADGIEALGPEQLGDRLAEVLIQVVFQGWSAAREGYRSASRSFVQASFRAICRSISSG